MFVNFNRVNRLKSLKSKSNLADFHEFKFISIDLYLIFYVELKTMLPGGYFCSFLKFIY